MAFISGVYFRTEDHTAPGRSEWKGHLARHLSERELRPRWYESERAVLVRASFGGPESEAWFDNQRRAAFIAGHPLLPGDSYRESRDGKRGAAVFGLSAISALPKVAATSAGTWAAAVYDASYSSLILLGDTLGVRPLYWYATDEWVAFASTMRFFEECALVDLEIDLQGLIERVSLGYSVGSKTPYQGLTRIGPSQIVTFQNSAISVEKYKEWPQVRPGGPLPADVLQVIRKAVEDRVVDPRNADVFLSGGMDSRVVATLISTTHKHVRSFNFSRPRSQDYVIAEMFAKEAGFQHWAETFSPGTVPDWSKMALRAINACIPDGAPSGDTRYAWSGDGGSVCGGWVYLTSQIVSHLQEGRVGEAVDRFLETYAFRISKHDLSRRAIGWHQERVKQAVMESLMGYKEKDLVRAFFLFLLENDQRRHLDAHFEEVCDRRIEFLLPFFDARVLDAFLTVPTERALYHRFYARWFAMLGPEIDSVPWQTYPEHVPCPLPLPRGATYQWTKGSAIPPGRQRLRLLLQRWRIIRRGLPHGLLRRPVLIARLILGAVGIREMFGATSYLDIIGKHTSSATKPRAPGSGP